ncbi:TIGR00269 family protein [Paucidesulfovibrio gracilis DSM 16080]|uniref:TIGR00269 family protein n=1 Tax=Paucidesulfovibrio gracilis DSM 16080 TaxID=1121449 RepID=A0A1T4XFT9_9BACT|nr:ATP-binding protein [Paucidesulfovibrio gracilis]SKA88390.1 TIGR00269 family protein [Paucidesulfovibrio gracilis DSM 16080]
MKCKRCREQAVVGLPSHNAAFCEPCFLLFFRRQVETAIRRQKLFTRQDRILVALSGGKDSLALMLELGRMEYDVTGLHIDLGIGESSRAARAKVEAFCEKHGFPLRVVEMEAEGLPMPLVKKYIKRPVCSVCGKVKRHYFNKVARDEGFNVLATGHNLDDEVARLFANTLRWDTAYLSDQGPMLPETEGFARKVKPLFRLSEFETANYAFLKGIEIHSDPCPFSSGASFTGHKLLWADLEHRSPGQKFGFYDKFLKNAKPAFASIDKEFGATLRPCECCGSPTSSERCGVCRVRDMLADKVCQEQGKDEA